MLMFISVTLTNQLSLQIVVAGFVIRNRVGQGDVHEKF